MQADCICIVYPDVCCRGRRRRCKLTVFVQCTPACVIEGGGGASSPPPLVPGLSVVSRPGTSLKSTPRFHETSFHLSKKEKKNVIYYNNSVDQCALFQLFNFSTYQLAFF